MTASVPALPPTLRMRSVKLYERAVTLRLPFRFGAATVTRCPQGTHIEFPSGTLGDLPSTAEWQQVIDEA